MNLIYRSLINILFCVCFSGLDIKREMSRYKSGLSSAPVAGFMVMYNKHTLRLEDLGTLEEQNWLNDQVKRGLQYLYFIYSFRC